MSKKALCIGINNYPGTDSDLSGCVNDATDWKNALESRNFSVQLLLDQKATKATMLECIQSIVTEAKYGDTVVITYSGHGSWIPDMDNDEPDSRDEVLCPYDIGQNRPLTDDELYDIFADRERGVRIVFISDSCHSGSVTRFAPIQEVSNTPRVRFLPPASFLPTDRLEVAEARALNCAYGKPRPFGGVLISGCQDTEYSYDASFNGRPNGAFTYFALQTLATLPPNSNYRAWFKAIRKYLPNPNHPQRPNLGGTHSQLAWQILE